MSRLIYQSVDFRVITVTTHRPHNTWLLGQGNIESIRDPTLYKHLKTYAANSHAHHSCVLAWENK